MIEYVRKHTGQLVCACSEGAAGDVVWACSLVLLMSAAVKESSQVLVAGPCQWHCIVLKAGKKVISSAWEQDILVRDGAGFLFVIP